MTQYVKAVKTPVPWHEMHSRQDRDVMAEVVRIGEWQMNHEKRVLYGREVDQGNIQLEPSNEQFRVLHLRPSSLVRSVKTAIYICDENTPRWGVRDFYYYVEFITPQEYVGHHLDQ